MTTYFVDPVNGLDANDGLGWWRLAFHAFGSVTHGGTSICGSGQAGSAQAFDDDPTTEWAANSMGPDWIGYDFGAGKTQIITKYSTSC